MARTPSLSLAWCSSGRKTMHELTVRQGTTCTRLSFEGTPILADLLAEHGFPRAAPLRRPGQVRQMRRRSLRLSLPAHRRRSGLGCASGLPDGPLGQRSGHPAGGPGTRPHRAFRRSILPPPCSRVRLPGPGRRYRHHHPGRPPAGAFHRQNPGPGRHAQSPRPPWPRT